MLQLLHDNNSEEKLFQTGSQCGDINKVEDDVQAVVADKGALFPDWLQRGLPSRSSLASEGWCGRWDSNPHDVAIEGF
ncbi:MAG: hypothetical protein V7632_4712 [Bradyrhizobium sp.]|jgi:hypothetical protein